MAKAASSNTSFEGFPPGAFAFYAELEEPGNNTKAWFDANRARYEHDARRPLEALLAAAAGEFGSDAKVFRPNRDVRFSKDKRPYKTSIAALIAIDGNDAGPGRYLHLDATGLLVGAGYHEFSREHLQRYRHAVHDERHGSELQQLVETARTNGLDVGGRTLTRGPRGVDPHHPRRGLLCHTAVTVMRELPQVELLSGPAAAEQVFDIWRDADDITRWLTRHIALADLPN
jgi:uncharacterized protein (TIGR02453 family)